MHQKAGNGCYRMSAKDRRRNAESIHDYEGTSAGTPSPVSRTRSGRYPVGPSCASSPSRGGTGIRQKRAAANKKRWSDAR